MKLVIKTNKRSKPLMALLCILSFVVPDAVNAATKPSRNARTKDYPNQEEYYSTAKKDISPADRRKADQLRVQTIDSIKKLLDSGKVAAGSRRFELLLRLGELYAERHDFMRDQEVEDYQASYDQWLAKGKKGKEPKINYRLSSAQLDKAAIAFRALVDQYPKNPRTAAALFALGKTLSRQGSDNSIIYFERIIKDHKKSEFVTDAYLAMGEFYFDKHKMEKAISAYKNVLKAKGSPLATYATYKLGWAYYDIASADPKKSDSRYDKSITAFKLVVKLSEQSQGKVGRLDLKQEAIKDLVMVWAETEDTKEAWAYFKKIDSTTSYYDLLERLGTTLADQGKNARAIDVFTKLVKESETRARNPDVYLRIVELQDISGNYKKVATTLEDMNTLYVQGSQWTIHNKDPNLLANAKSLVEKSIHRYATVFHQRGQKSKSTELLANAASLYNTYLTSFPTSKNAPELRFYMADILLDFKKYESAGDNFMMVAKSDQASKSLKEKAALQAVVAVNLLDQNTKFDKLPPSGQVPSPIELPRVKKRLVETLDQYVAMQPKNKDGYPMRFTAAQTYFNYGHYDVASERLKKIVSDLPGTKQANASARMLVAFEIDRRKWDSATALSQQFLNDKRLADKELREYLSGTLKFAMYQRAMDLEKGENYKSAAEAFLAFQARFPGETKSADLALNNAAANYYKAGMLEEALMAGQRLIDKYPESKLTPRAILKMAETNEALAAYDQAAQLYKRFALSYPSEKGANLALFNAATLFKGLQRFEDAENLYARYIKTYQQDALNDDARFELAQMQEKQRQYAEAASSYGTLAKIVGNQDPNLALEARAKQAVLQLRFLNAKDGWKNFEEVRRSLQAKGAPAALEARDLMAGYLFEQSEAQFAQYNKTKVQSSSQIQGFVKIKQEELIRLGKKYEAVVALASPEYTIAALYRLGQAHEGFSENLLKAPAPNGASAADLNKFKSIVEKLGNPLRDEAYKYYETAYNRSSEVELFSPWTRLTYDKMAELAPEKHPEVLEQSVNASYVSQSLTPQPHVASLVD